MTNIPVHGEFSCSTNNTDNMQIFYTCLCVCHSLLAIYSIGLLYWRLKGVTYQLVQRRNWTWKSSTVSGWAACQIFVCLRFVNDGHALILPLACFTIGFNLFRCVQPRSAILIYNSKTSIKYNSNRFRIYESRSTIFSQRDCSRVAIESFNFGYSGRCSRLSALPNYLFWNCIAFSHEFLASLMK